MMHAFRKMRGERDRRYFNSAVAVLLCCSVAWGQTASIEPQRPSAPVLWRPYLATTVPPARLLNSGRLARLVRAGTLYLTAQDAVALALENNIDIEIARYNAISADWKIERAQAGGALPGVPSAASQAGTVASGQGVAGSQAAAGININGSNGGASNTGNATIAQVGPVTQTLDPSIQDTSAFAHRSAPQPNSQLSGLPNLVSDTRSYSSSIQEGFLLGGSVTLTYNEHYLRENAPTDFLNPSMAPQLLISGQLSLLRGFGVGVNERTITVAKINRQTSDLNFRAQVISVVASVLNAYYTLVADRDDVTAKKSTLEVSRSFLEENRKRVELGTLAPLDITTAESQLAVSEQDLVVSEANLEQKELQLKNLISRIGLADPVLKSVHIEPLDRIAIPDKDELPPVGDLMKTALANRSDLLAEVANIKTAEVSALGTTNGILPSLTVFASQSQAGLAGTPNPTAQRAGRVADPYFVGGMGNALGQVLRRDFPSERAGVLFSAPLGNRQAQADFGIDQLSLRQTQLATQKDLKQLEVDVLSAVVAVKQSRARYEAAVRNRILAEQLFAAEQKKYALGASTPYTVVQNQRDLAAAKSSETAALVGYSDGRVTLDQTLGTILDANHVAIADAKSGVSGLK
ncbi:MAG: outer rane efflux protein [Bryobacterales bacterium]|nr:outer rane efflux protein [Bryobacterales bacterium]